MRLNSFTIIAPYARLLLHSLTHYLAYDAAQILPHHFSLRSTITRALLPTHRSLAIPPQPPFPSQASHPKNPSDSFRQGPHLSNPPTHSTPHIPNSNIHSTESLISVIMKELTTSLPGHQRVSVLALPCRSSKCDIRECCQNGDKVLPEAHFPVSSILRAS